MLACYDSSAVLMSALLFNETIGHLITDFPIRIDYSSLIFVRNDENRLSMNMTIHLLSPPSFSPSASNMYSVL